jgi:hypothetical protein
MVYHASGAADVYGCLNKATWGGCTLAALTILLTIATMGEGEIDRTIIQGAVEAGSAAAEHSGTAAVKMEIKSIKYNGLPWQERIPRESWQPYTGVPKPPQEPYVHNFSLSQAFVDFLRIPHPPEHGHG